MMQHRQAERLIDLMLAAQTRFAATLRDGVPLTWQQKLDQRRRDIAREQLMGMIPHATDAAATDRA